MATGTTLSILTRADKSYQAASSSSDAGTPTLGTITIVYHDDETQMALIRALENAKLWVIQNVVKR